MFEQFLHFPDLFSLLDIFLPLFLLLLFCPDINDDSLGFDFQQYVCFPKKSICFSGQGILRLGTLFGV